MTVVRRKKTEPIESKDTPVFIDLADYPVRDDVNGKRIKVIRPKESADLRSLKTYILSRITVLADLTGYGGDVQIAHNMIGDAVAECGGHMWVVNQSTVIASPYDVEVDNGQ